MCHRCYYSFLSALILVFTFWQTSVSFWVIVVSAVLILIKGLHSLSECGCSGMKSLSYCKCENEHHMGSEVFGEKGKKPRVPSKGEVRETMKKK